MSEVKRYSSSENENVEVSTRLRRLIGLEGYIYAKAGQYECHDVLARIVHLRDEEGVLKVYWKETPFPEEREAVQAAWSEFANEDAANVEHAVVPFLAGADDDAFFPLRKIDASVGCDIILS